MKVVVVAGGKGTRIRSVTEEIPKAMIPVNGKPVLEHQLEMAKRYGYNDFLFLTGHLGSKIEEYFGTGEKWDVFIEYYQEKSPLGTAGAFAEVADKLSSDFWVFYGDTIMNFDMERMLSFHKIHRSQATLFLHPNDHPEDSDLVEISEDCRVSGFFPKPHENKSYLNLTNAALYILSPEMLQYITKNQRSDFGKDVFPNAFAAGMNMYGFVSAEYIKDMGTPERYELVCMDAMSGKVTRFNRGL
jgi:NDP-sugar pyrophosphorylase family protein